MPKKQRTRPGALTKRLVISTDQDRATWDQLRSNYASDGELLRAAVNALHAQTFPPDTTGAILAWGPVLSALRPLDCTWCKDGILEGEDFRQAVTVSGGGSVFAHAECVEAED